MKKAVIITASLALLISVLYQPLRGNKIEDINLPVLTKNNHPAQFHGRPIPYHEVLLVYRHWFEYKVIVYNDLNNVLSDEDFFALNEDSIKAETGCDRVIFNGPRFWVLDNISQVNKGPIRSLEGHPFAVPGYLTMSLSDILNRSAYSPYQIKRDTKYTYNGDSDTYRLYDPEGNEYVMQAASREVKDLSINELSHLQDFLDLPEGWTYKKVHINQPLILNSHGTANIVQDNLRNTYQRIEK